MDVGIIERDPERLSRKKYALALCFVGLAINVIGVRIARLTGIPLFLDNIGTVLSAVLGGTIPGIAVGFFTNLINAIGDGETAYYGCLSVMIAIASIIFEHKGFFSFKKPLKLLVVIVVFAIIGGALGSILTWALYGLSFGNGISAPLAHKFYEAGKLSVFWSQFFADLIIDLADKAITVLIVTTILSFLPEKLRKQLFFAGWRQTPLSEEKISESDKQSNRFSLQSKIILLVASAMLIVAGVVTAISFIHYRRAAIQEQINLAEGVVSVAAKAVDGDRVDEYIEKGFDADGYDAIYQRFFDLANSSENVQFVYAYQIQEDGCHVVFDADTPDLEGSEPGEVVEFDEAFLNVLPSLLAGDHIDPIISNEKFGWLLSVYEPIFDSAGKCKCYIGVDINMNQITIDGYQFLARVISLLVGFFLLILAITIWLAEYNVILPINAMSLSTGHFAYDSGSAREEAVESLRELDIKTGDEIENLYHSVTKTTEDMVAAIENEEHQKQVVTKMQNGLILVLADMVESRDECTGQHVRKTAAYTDVIMRELKKEGVYTDKLTDEFVSDVFNSAPLHDIGKIKVSDVILNKPGKLTDEEFEIMKTHTTAGSEVIEHAIRLVSEKDSAYLKEANNLALYHHEKWNGTGYPMGLKGEQIPLSARIMAVADVFDALVSVRSYKKSFTFEQAMDIIKEGSGTHFDPAIVKAFVNASDQVRKVMNTNMAI
ncbi:MAG: HD domain-containing protein [Spirochaetales bacterium]|nr:HD domain-containing protein [Spirochaetales bacterium]MBO6048908.1 HD domain-containing protein [Spirochaetales bacterium]